MPLTGLGKLQLHIARAPEDGDGPYNWEKKCVMRRGIDLMTLLTKVCQATVSNSTQHRKQPELIHSHVKLLPVSEFEYPTSLTCHYSLAVQHM